jgi:hypothetical protein
MVHTNTDGNDDTTVGFTVAIRGVYELNSSGMPVAFLDLNRPYPVMDEISGSAFNDISGVSVLYQNVTQTVDVTFTLSANEFLTSKHVYGCNSTAVKDGSGKVYGVPGPAQVAVVFHISACTAFVKFDFLVNQWTWAT